MLLFTLPLIIMYILFFGQAFKDDITGQFSLNNFQFLVGAMRLKQTTVPPIWGATKNTVLFSVIATFIEVVISLLSGYTLSRIPFKGKSMIVNIILVLRLFPTTLLLIGVLYVLIVFKIVNSLTGVICVAIALRIPSSTYIIKSFFDTVPQDIENASYIDGCNRFQSFTQVIIHMIRPGIASITVFSFMSAWSNYILFNTLIFDGSTPVIATYLRNLASSEQMVASYAVFAAMGIIYMTPIVIFYLLSQRLIKDSFGISGKGL